MQDNIVETNLEMMTDQQRQQVLNEMIPGLDEFETIYHQKFDEFTQSASKSELRTYVFERGDGSMMQVVSQDIGEIDEISEVLQKTSGRFIEIHYYKDEDLENEPLFSEYGLFYPEFSVEMSPDLRQLRLKLYNNMQMYQKVRTVIDDSEEQEIVYSVEILRMIGDSSDESLDQNPAFYKRVKADLSEEYASSFIDATKRSVNNIQQVNIKDLDDIDRFQPRLISYYHLNLFTPSLFKAGQVKASTLALRYPNKLRNLVYLVGFAAIGINRFGSNSI